SWPARAPDAARGWTRTLPRNAWRCVEQDAAVSWFFLRDLERRFETQVIALRTESRNGSFAGRRGQKRRAVRLGLGAAMHVRKMHFHGGDIHRLEGVTDGDAGVRVRRGIDDDGVELFARLLDARHQLALDVGLKALDLGAGGGSAHAELAVDFGERQAPVH